MAQDRTLQTVITAAGDSRKLFLDAGFSLPKSLIKIGDLPIISRAISSYFIGSGELRIAVNREEDIVANISKVILSTWPEAKVIPVPSLARGALASALLASVGLDRDLPVVIAAGDSEVVGGIKSQVDFFLERGFAAGTIVFRSSGDRWSYVSTDKEGRVLEISEKYQIGNLATTGVFFFANGQYFFDAAQWVLVNNAEVNGRFFVSSLLNYMVSQGESIGYSEIDPAVYKTYALPADLIHV